MTALRIVENVLSLISIVNIVYKCLDYFGLLRYSRAERSAEMPGIVS